MKQYPTVESLLREQNPEEPVYCIYPHIYREKAKSFLEGFPGRVLYAVKANPEPTVIQLLREAGIQHYDCASLPEVKLAHSIDPTAKKYFMTPARIRGSASIAQNQFNVHHFVVDHLNGLKQLLAEINPHKSVIFARMAVHHESASEDLSVRFGAPEEEVVNLLNSIRSSGAEPAFAFNVGSLVASPDAYNYALSKTESVLSELPFEIRLLDVGGGFPTSYPQFIVPKLENYFNTLRESIGERKVFSNLELLGEPGRALAAPGLSAVVEVILRKEERLFLNDGMFGIFWLLGIDGPNSFPVRVFRGAEQLKAPTKSFILNGPTCDSTDTLPGRVELPENIQAGDHLEFGNIGAYSLGGRTNYNGFYSDNIVQITSPDARPPLIE